MRRVLWVLMGLASLGAIGGSVAARAGGSAAGEAGQTQMTISAQAAALHKEAIVIDAHTHIMTPVFHQGIDPWKVNETGLFDYARARQGGLDVVVHAIYTEDAYHNYNYGVKQAMRLIGRFYEILAQNQDKMELALTSDDVRRIVAKGKMAAILALEGQPDMEGDLDVLRSFYQLGVRLIEFTCHDTTSALADAWIDQPKWGGISAKGREMVREMNRLGIVIDIAHASEKAMFQLIEASRAPVIDTHTHPEWPSGRREGQRTTSDEMLMSLAAKGGMMSMHHSAATLSKKYAEWQRANLKQRPAPRDDSGAIITRGRLATLVLPNKGIRPPNGDFGEYIAALDAEMHDNWVRERTAERGGTGYGTPWKQRQARLIEAGAPLPTVADWANQLDHVVKLVGDDHAGIGLDLMAGGEGLLGFDASQYARFTEAMLQKGMSHATIKKVLGENFLRLLDQAKVPGIAPPTWTPKTQ